jgi:hypothetical protein
MTDTPTQSLIVRLPADKARRVICIVDLPGSAYDSVDEFIRVAVENQLTLESAPNSGSAQAALDGSSAHTQSAGKATPSGPAAPSKAQKGGPALSTPVAANAAIGEVLGRPDLEGLIRHEPMPTAGHALSSFTNRLTPLLAGPRVLANLSVDGNAPSVDTYRDLTAKAARAFGFRLRSEDDVAGRRGRYRRSTAWPVGDDESKSLIRYRSCFMFMAEPKGGLTGPLLDLGLVAVADGKVFLTDSGAEFASATVPALDNPEGVDLLSKVHRDILAKALVLLSVESREIQQFLAAMERVSGSQDEIDKDLAESHKEWSEAQVVSHRAAMVGRLRDIQVIDVEPLPSAKSFIVPGENFNNFLELIKATT